MNRVLLAISLLLVPSACSAAAQVFELSGEITDGQFLGPFPVDFNEPFQPAPFPYPYTGLLTYDPVNSSARFQFTANVGGVPVEHFVGSVVDEIDHSNIYPGIQQFNATAILIDFQSPISAFITSFDMSVDRATGQGMWQWQEDCPVCLAVLPAASATITSFRLVPEPSTAVGALWLVAAICFRMPRSRT